MIAVFIVICALGWLLETRERHLALKSALSAETGLKQTLTERTEATLRLSTLRQAYLTTQHDLNRFLQWLPKEQDIARLIDNMTNLSQNSGLDLYSLELREEQQHEFGSSLPTVLHLRGRYHQFTAFVSAIENMNKIVTLENFTIVARNASPEVDIQVTLEIHHHGSNL